MLSPNFAPSAKKEETVNAPIIAPFAIPGTSINAFPSDDPTVQLIRPICFKVFESVHVFMDEPMSLIADGAVCEVLPAPPTQDAAERRLPNELG